MHAAVVDTFGSPPRYREFPEPRPEGEHQTTVEVLASGLHPRVRSQADGSHYTSTDELPLIPGIDGVGRMADGGLVYFVLPDTRLGAMAERVVIDTRRSIVLSDGGSSVEPDPVVLAAAMNPGMSSWVALRRRVAFQAGQRILVLGATGSAGQMAVQIAKHLGAAHVVAAGRDPGRLDGLRTLGADSTVSMLGGEEVVAERLGEAAGDVDVVIDYLWGAPAAAAMLPILRHRRDRGEPLTWVQIGSVAGPAAEVPSAALRQADFRIVGSGQGSVSTTGILAELPALAEQISRGAFTLNTRAVPLSDVEQAWSAPIDPDERIVVIPGPTPGP
jgi:NADPH:quinone reductase-like Zn-dependent oxidoreductase